MALWYTCSDGDQLDAICKEIYYASYVNVYDSFNTHPNFCIMLRGSSNISQQETFPSFFTQSNCVLFPRFWEAFR